MTETITGWALVEAGAPLKKLTIPKPELQPGELLVEVAGCGVCHTDISFIHMGVKTRAPLPLILGHEISGTVCEVGEGVDEHLKNTPVLIPAVLPCGTCDLCQDDKRTICRKQIMPGNDRHGGFSSHVVVPARYVCPVPQRVLDTHELYELSIVSDAVTTPFMAIKRSGLREGDLAIVIGAGGIGVHAVQIAAAIGAKVIALDIDKRKLDLAAESGAHATIDSSALSFKELRGKVREEAKRIGAPKFQWKIFECSGTGPGQETGFGLMTFGGYLAIVGFTMAKMEARFSNLMAFDATMQGNWGCDPELYPEVMEWIADGRIKVKPYLKRYALDDINDVINAAHHGELLQRAIVVP